MKTRRAIPVLVLVVTAGMLGCSYPISKELRQEARQDLTFPMVQANPDAYKGAVVIWGGRVIKTDNLKDATEIYVLEVPLDSRQRPKEDVTTQGRFIAGSSKYLDPEVYRPGKQITVAGQLIGQRTDRVGEIDYVYPVVEIRQIHLWQPDVIYAYPGPWYGYGLGWGWGWWGPSYYVVPTPPPDYYRDGGRQQKPR